MVNFLQEVSVLLSSFSKSEAGKWLCDHPKNKFVFLFNRREEKQGNLLKHSFDKLALA
ncbi:hypothetical protein G3E57_004485 [Salmonella enterica]|nr:hypothetical protein [Salmonella enterica]EDR9525841.1 hypothetical protein [Salmonella enterica subsp. enterica serovar Infantis]EDV4945788.1 hypothetical protein [Salmonella enterica subsp. enterica]EDR1239269.1 hypothetical protein [Salmonella enterica]EDY1722544.1 hypothetical protein [Salmonella enterica]